MSTIQVEWVAILTELQKWSYNTKNSNKPETVYFFFCSVKASLKTPQGVIFLPLGKKKQLQSTFLTVQIPLISSLKQSFNC